ncbi:MAG: efflux RND transporter permease subunit, partial [Bacillota bacterium]
EGAELQAPLSTAVIGGLLFSTVLTLVVIPVMYTIVDDMGSKMRGKLTRKPRASTGNHGDGSCGLEDTGKPGGRF